MKLYFRKISRKNIPQQHYRETVRAAQQEMLGAALEEWLASEGFPKDAVPSSALMNPADAQTVRQSAFPLPPVLRSSHGKPYLADYPSFHYNFSDSGDWLVLAVSENDSEIGVDLQKIVPVKAGIMKMARRFFHPDDVRRLEAVSHPEDITHPDVVSHSEEISCPEAKDDAVRQEELFFRIWTVKEAYLKYTGEGLSGGMSRFPVDFEKETIGGVPFEEVSPPAPGYLLTVCCNQFMPASGLSRHPITPGSLHVQTSGCYL